MIEVTIREEKVEGKETISFIDALTDRLGITGIMTQVHRITMIHIGGMMIIVQRVQTALLCTSIPTTLENLLGEAAARLKLYKKKAMRRSM